MQNNFSRISSTSQFHPPLFQFCIKIHVKIQAQTSQRLQSRKKNLSYSNQKWRTLSRERATRDKIAHIITRTLIFDL
uniref:Uncharacterized protein n=1 Tax=Anguilla anguilla TaxID=7936 RepID=A0A0E9RV53_ANGAN